MSKLVRVIVITAALAAPFVCVDHIFGQASTIVSGREPIAVYAEEDLNPIAPRFEWTGDTLMRGIRVIDGMGNPPMDDQDLLIVDGLIAGVGPTGSLEAPTGTRIIEGAGQTVLPGLIDVHVHLAGGWRGGNDNGNRPLLWKWQLYSYLYSGITHIFDIGNNPQISGDVRDIVAAGGVVGPGVTIAGQVFETAPVGSYGGSFLLQVPDAGFIGKQLERQKNIYGVEMVKCHSGTNSQILRILVAEAHARDMRVVCDLWHNNGSPWIARQTHLDGFAHNLFMAVPPTPEHARILAEEGTFVIATTVVLDAFTGRRFQREGIDYVNDPLILNVIPPDWIERHNRDLLEVLERYAVLPEMIVNDVTHINQMYDQGIAWTKMLVDAGVRVGLGTDAPYPTVWPGESMHREMEIWVNESGVSPIRTLKAATFDNARILKLEDKVGSIQTGLKADLLVVQGNPAMNISDTRNIRHIFLNGMLVDRESLTRQWRY